MFFPGRNTYIHIHIYIYILDPPSHHKKVVYHIIFIVLSTFQGIWRFRVYECTWLRISLFFVHFAGLGQDSMKSFNEPTGSPKALLLIFPIP